MAKTAEPAPDAPAASPITLDKVLTRGGGGVVIAVLFWMQSTLGGVLSKFDSMQRDVADVKTAVVKVTTELAITSPSDLADRMLSPADVRQILAEHAPWIRDRDGIERRLRELEARVKALEKP